MKDIIFAGCSYTWGQSLWYEANFPNDNHPRDGFFYGNKVCEECYEYIVENRFANQVAKYFKKNALVAATNGGDLIQSINFVKNKISENTFNGRKTELVIFQTTQFTRYDSLIDYQIEMLENLVLDLEKQNVPIRFVHWIWPDLTQNEIDLYISGVNTNWGKLAPRFSKNKIPVIKDAMPPGDSNKLASEIIRSRTIKLNGNFNFQYITEIGMATKRNDYNKIKDYTIYGKFGMPKDAVAPDTHFSQEGHNFIAQEIIKHLENEQPRIFSI